MPFRDLAVTLTIMGLLPVCLARPWIGVLVWSWIGYMNPHRLTWGFAYDLPFAMLVALATLTGFVFTRERKPFLWTRETVLILLLWGWFTVSSVFAMYPDSAWAKWEEISKILLMALLAIPLFQDRRRLRLLLLVIAASLGFYGFKGGLFALATGGQWMVLGPPGSFFEANTELSLALNMSLPISFYLAREEQRRWLRLTLRAVFFLTILAVPFTYSRAGVLGLAVVLVVLFFRARARLLLVPLVLGQLLAFIAFAPAQFFERVETISQYEQDGSAQLRFMSWRVGYEIARDRPVLGGGFTVFIHRATYDIYLPEYPRPFGHDAHSIYFNLLGEHGWIGLGIFVALVVSTLSTLHGLRRAGAIDPEKAWISNYAKMIQASILAYLITGAFLSVAYFDLTYQLFVITIILKRMAREQVPALAPKVAPVPVSIHRRPSKVSSN
jgi:probable O-glycosylation ligase (exosortase A-associated)